MNHRHGYGSKLLMMESKCKVAESLKDEHGKSAKRVAKNAIYLIQS